MRDAFAAEPPTFGAAFFRAALVAPQAADALLTLLGERREELERLPPERQQRIAAIFRAAMFEAGAQYQKSEPILRGIEWLERQRDPNSPAPR
jgi:hypothetical protein